MPEAQTGQRVPSQPRGTSGGGEGRGRRRGGGRGRGRGNQQGARPTDGTQIQQQDARSSRPHSRNGDAAVGASSEGPAPNRERSNDGGRGRGERRWRGRGRGAASGQHHRRPPPPAELRSNPPTESGLSATAAEFIPGQPVQSSRSRPASSRPVVPPATPARQPAQRRMSKSSAADLPTRIQEDIDNGQYECVICANEVVRTSRVWSCPTCSTVTHLHCVKKWYTNQSKAREENQDPNQPTGWRCPGCNSSLTETPDYYHCWCGKDFDPKPIPGLPPHTCGQTCSKTRPTCPHPCTLLCHAGPCPPCTLMGPSQTCFCGKHTITKKCIESDYGKGWSCGEICGDLLPCGEHACSRECHSGLCGACEVPVLSTCYCGKEQREVPCDQRDDILESFNYGQLQQQKPDDDDVDSSWFEGSYACRNTCERPFDCGHHTCQKPCHPQDERPAHCPLSPDVVTHCPCGKTPLQSISPVPRRSCQDTIPHCDKLCNKTLGCGHRCQEKCHTGPCAPCSQYVDISCRCGRTTVNAVCHQGDLQPPMCFKVCKAQLNCGRHECGERCCPGEKKASERRRQKRTANENFEAEHICLQICGRQLKCGEHTCQQLCHRGQCPSCLEAIFDEIACSCGRTVLQPPQPCGTKPPECRFDCTRVPPCGHPAVSHQCHPDDVPCTKCPFLVEKLCICGKRILKNQPCWFEEARCGLPCGRKLKCGNHECKKPCHKPGECEDAGIAGSHCPQACGKVRKSCEHNCMEQCHAPYPCKEDKPCEFKTLITCPCQHRRQEVRCLATKLNPWPNRDTMLKCDDECLRLQRNRLVADALKIDADHTDNHIPYSDTTMRAFKEDPSWTQAREREMRLFALATEEKRLRFKPMPANRRAFLHSLAEDYGLDSVSEDPEPHRHVCIFKTPRFVSPPHKTLAQCGRILKAAAVASGAQTARQPAAVPQHEAFNGFLLKDPRFGLTIDELDRAIAAELAAASRSGPALTFTTSFLASEEIVIKASPVTRAAAVAASHAATTPQSIEAALAAIKSPLAKTISRLGLAGAVFLCHVDSSLNITRREGDAAASTSGWSDVVSRGSWRRVQPQAPQAPPPPVPRTFLALKKVDVKKKEKEKVTEEVEDDWLAAVEKEEGASAEKEGSLGEKQEVSVGEGDDGKHSEGEHEQAVGVSI